MYSKRVAFSRQHREPNYFSRIARHVARTIAGRASLGVARMSAQRARRRSKGDGVNILAARLAKTAAAPPPSPWQDRADSWSASFSGRSASERTPPSGGAAPRRVARADDGRDVPRQPTTPAAGRSPESPPPSARSRASATAAAAAAAAVAHLAMDDEASGRERSAPARARAPSRLLERRRAKGSALEHTPESDKNEDDVSMTNARHRGAQRLGALDVSPSDAFAESSRGSYAKNARRRRSTETSASEKSPRSPGAASLASPRGVTTPTERDALRERARRAEARAARAEAAARDAERAHLSLTRRRLAAESARDASARESSRLATRAAETESRLALCEASLERWRERAVSLENAERANRLAPDQATDCFLKAGFLAHYWRLAYRLGIEPRSSWREAELWTERAPAGGDAALLNVVRAVRDAADAGVGQGPAFCRAAAIGDSKLLRDASPETNPKTEDAYAACAPAPRRAGGWAPATRADLAEVETAMRGLVSARIEEGVLVALADRRRALANRVATFSTRAQNLKTEDARDVARASPAGGSPWRCDKGPTRDFHAASPLPEPARLTNADGVDPEPWIVLSDAEIGEVKYRRLWVCWQWARARGRAHETALTGLAEPRCDTWFRRAFGEQAVFAAAREALEVERALAEIRALGVERALCAAANAAT